MSTLSFDPPYNILPKNSHSAAQYNSIAQYSTIPCSICRYLAPPCQWPQARSSSSPHCCALPVLAGRTAPSLAGHRHWQSRHTPLHSNQPRLGCCSSEHNLDHISPVGLKEIMARLTDLITAHKWRLDTCIRTELDQNEFETISISFTIIIYRERTRSMGGITLGAVLRCAVPYLRCAFRTRSPAATWPGRMTTRWAPEEPHQPQQRPCDCCDWGRWGHGCSCWRR